MSEAHPIYIRCASDKRAFLDCTDGTGGSMNRRGFQMPIPEPVIIGNATLYCGHTPR